MSEVKGFFKNIFIYLLQWVVAACGISSSWHIRSSSLTKDWSPALGAQALSHWNTRKIPQVSLKKHFFKAIACGMRKWVRMDGEFPYHSMCFCSSKIALYAHKFIFQCVNLL